MNPVKPIDVSPVHCTPADLRRVLGSTPFFKNLSTQDIDIIADMFQQTHYVPGESIQIAGDQASRLSIVAAGMVKVVRPTPDGQDVLLEIQQPGEFFGSLSMLGDSTYSDSVTAHTHTCVLRASSEDFQALLERYPSAALATLSFVAARLREAHESIEQLSAKPVEQRVSATLLKLADRVGRDQDGAILIDMPLSRQDIADMTGATIETVSRVISEFRREGVIESGRRWMSIIDRPRLEAISVGEILV